MLRIYENIRSWTLALPVSWPWYSCKRNAVLTIPVSNLKLEGMEHLRNILDQPKRKFTLGEKVYIGSMTIVLSCRIALYILLRITGCVKRLI